MLGNNMFAYCCNNPVNFTDSAGMRCVHILSRICGGTGISHETSTLPSGPNTDNMLKFFGVSSVEELPDMPANAMVFMENTTVIRIGLISVIHERTVVMDCEKYCEYTFTGVGGPGVGFPYDFNVTKGYVYGVEDVSDYSGIFFGGSFNYLSDIAGGAFATNGVTAEIISGNGFVSSSLGTSITNYSTPQSGWIHGKANINWYQRHPYQYTTPWDSPLIL